MVVYHQNLGKYASQFSDNAITFKAKKKNINFQV